MPVRVLQVVTTLNRGGLETMLLNYYRSIDRDKVQFDFLLHRDEKSDYEDEVLSMGANVYRVPALNPFSPVYYKALDKFFSEHHYDIVHSHLDCMSAFPLAVAKKHGVPHRFAHAHNINQDKDFKYPVKLVSKKIIPAFSTELFACSNEAGKWMFSCNEFAIINNAIDAKKYVYNPLLYSTIKKELNIENKFVIGHVGRFNPQKNHTFLIKMFSILLKEIPEACLLLIGDGNGKEAATALVKSLNISDSVLFLGVRADIPRLLQAVDVFVFPSIYEGLSLATVEAQAAGLPCVLSDSIPHECKITENVEFISLECSAKQWAARILKYQGYQKSDTYDAISKAGFDISENAKNLQEFYLNKVNG